MYCSNVTVEIIQFTVKTMNMSTCNANNTECNDLAKSQFFCSHLQLTEKKNYNNMKKTKRNIIAKVMKHVDMLNLYRDYPVAVIIPSVIKTHSV